MLGCNCWFVLLPFLATSSAGIWKTVNRPFYKLTFYNTVYSWSGAKSLCGSGSSLVQLDVSSIKNDVLNTISSGSAYWIGATDEANEGHWKWLDGSSASITSWNPEEPSGGRSENYLVIDKRGDFYDFGLNYQTGVICMEAIPFTISSGIYKLTAIVGLHPKVTYETARTECAKIQSRILKLTSTTEGLIKTHLNSNHFRPDDKLWLENTGSTCYSFTLSDYTSRTTHCTDKHYYICEQAGPHEMQLSQTNFIVTSYTGKKEITCMVSGFPPPTVKWMKGNIVLTSTPLNNQFKNGQKLVLDLNKLTIADEGQYKCFASNTVGQIPHSVSDILNIQVPSQPSIINITSSPCNSNLLITWKPHVRGLGIKHSSNHRNSFTTPNNVSIRSNVTDLQPSTSYIIKIEPCLTTPPTCFSHYTTTTHATTGGLPGPISKQSLKMTYDGYCNVSWSTVMNPKYISDYKLVISSTKSIVSSYYKDDFKMNEMLLPSHITSYVLPKKFNRKYNVSIRAKTCAGFGAESKAVGECATDTNAPSSIQSPSTRSEIPNSGILEFSINIPDETNGPISCYFIIVQVNKTSNTSAGFSNARMSKLNKSEIEDEYIAIALNRPSVGHNRPKMSLILGDQVKTSCDISGKSNSGNGNNSKNTYVAHNKRLSPVESYRIFLVTSTPTKESVSFGASEGLLIVKSFTDITLAVVAGGILAVLSAFGCLCYVRHRNNKMKDEFHEIISSISLNVSKKEKIKHVSAGTTSTDTQHQLNTSINPYETIAGASNDYEDITDPSEWNPYEIAVGQYEDVL